MRHLSKHKVQRSAKAGLPPGSLVYVGQKKDTTISTRITVMEYDRDHLLRECKVSNPRELLPLKPAPAVTWINVDAVHDEATLKTFAELFNLHPLMVEDILNMEQRPKCDYTENAIYVILKLFSCSPENEIMTEQVSIVIGENYVITFEEEIGDEFDPVRERLRQEHSRLRKGGSDYLAYSLIDTVVDQYFLVLERLGETLESLEEKLSLTTPGPHVLQQIHYIKRELIFLRKSIWPVRDVINSLLHSDNRLLSEQTLIYLRDVHDHTIQIMDTMETYRDLLSSIQDLYLSVISNRMNEIMKVLTVISTVFIPLTFIVGVYGMNFRFMPELAVPWAYPVVWSVMILIAAGMIVYFKRKKWF